MSFDAATLLARMIPYELLAAERARVFWRLQDAKRLDDVSAETISDIRISVRSIAQRQWLILLGRPGAAGSGTRCYRTSENG